MRRSIVPPVFRHPAIRCRSRHRSKVGRVVVLVAALSSAGLAAADDRYREQMLSQQRASALADQQRLDTQRASENALQAMRDSQRNAEIRDKNTNDVNKAVNALNQTAVDDARRRLDAVGQASGAVPAPGGGPIAFPVPSLWIVGQPTSDRFAALQMQQDGSYYLTVLRQGQQPAVESGRFDAATATHRISFIRSDGHRDAFDWKLASYATVKGTNGVKAELSGRKSLQLFLYCRPKDTTGAC